MKGAALISVLIISSLLSLLAIGFATIMVSENKISRAQELSAQTHYLAEAGIQRAIWQLNNDSEWKTDFEQSALSRSLELNSLLYPNDRVEIQATSIANGEAWIDAIGFLNQAQRHIKVRVYKAVGDPSKIEPKSLFCDKLAYLWHSKLKTDDNIFMNASLNLWAGSHLSTDKTIFVVKKVHNHDSTINGEVIENSKEAEMPGLDFAAYKAQAQEQNQVFTSEEFSSLLESPTVLSGIVYVTGSIDINKNQSLVVNGMLLADGNIETGADFGQSRLQINHVPGSPSGIATKGWLSILKYTNTFNVTGLVYALREVYVSKTANLIIQGGIITKNFQMVDQNNFLDITFDSNLILEALGEPINSPIITIQQWEEEY